MIGECFSTIHRKHRTDLPPGKMRVRRILLKIAHFRKFGEVTANVAEGILPFPLTLVEFQNTDIFVLIVPENKDSGVFRLFFVYDQPQRFRREISKPDISQILVTLYANYDRSVVELGAFRSIFTKDACRDQPRFEAKVTQQFIKEAI